MNSMNNCTDKTTWQDAKIRSVDKLKRDKELRVLEYDKDPNKCKQCGSIFSYSKRHNKFCNRSCAATFNNKGICRNTKKQDEKCDIKCCLECGSVISDGRNKFCSQKCASTNRHRLSVEYWEANYTSIHTLPYGIRNHILEINGNKCCLCGWDKINPYSGRYSLVVDHIDGNSTNNAPTNLRVICPNCDSLTKTYMALNKGNGRLKRRLRYAIDKNK